VTGRLAVPLAVAVGGVGIAGMTVLGGVTLPWSALLGVPVAGFTLLWLLAPGGVEPIWAPLPDPSAKATEHQAASLANRLAEARDSQKRFRTRLQPRLARLALVRLRRAGIEELHDPRAAAVLGDDLYRLVTDPNAILPESAAAARLFAILEEG
jgi:hypothetical protein